MKITKLIKAVGVAVALCLPIVGATQTLRYNTFMPPLALETKGIQQFFVDLKAATDGRVKGQVFVGGQMLGGQATLSGIRDGVVDGGFIIPTLNASEIPYVAMLPELLPFASNFWAATGATNETIMLNCDECRADLDKYKAVWLGGIGASPWYMMCRQPISSVDDLHGKKIRVTGGFAIRMISALGATAVSLPASEIPAAMQQGVIDCAVGTLSWLNTLGLSNMVKGVIDEPFGSYHGIGQFVFNKNSLAKLSAADRKVLMEMIPKYLAKLNGAYAADEQKARKVGEEKGIKFWKPDAKFDAIMAAFRAKEPQAVAKDIVSQGGSADAERIVRAHIATLDKWNKLVANVDGDTDAFAALLQQQIYSKLQH